MQRPEHDRIQLGWIFPHWCRVLTHREEPTVTDLKKGARITGSDRSKLAIEIKKQYEKGRSIRELADSHNRSYGFIHRLLSENEVTLRGRGGATRGKRK
jgi:hypothetical protein